MKWNEDIYLTECDLFHMDRRLITNVQVYSATSAKIPQSHAEHQMLKENVRRRLLLSAGLNPMPQIPVNPPYVSEGKEYCGTLIKAVRIESAPGLFLTGNLFLPEKFSAPLPAVLCPHGHWPEGRVDRSAAGGVAMRCFQLARLGFAVFAYDMIGYNDSNNFPHRWYGEFKRKADLAGISTFGMQTLNSLRAVDFIASLPEVDPERIACTGASGGGSQTWFVTALDERIKFYVPVCMLSSHFQGGCACEEGPLLRTTGLTSFDIAASIAPRPVMLPAVSGDWTNLNPVYEVPMLKKVYALFGAENKVDSCYFDDDHNYNQRTREHVYAWLVKNMQGIDHGRIIPEENIAPPPPELLWHNGCKPEELSTARTAAAFAKVEKFYNSTLLPDADDLTGWQNSRRELLADILRNRNEPAPEFVAERPTGAWDMTGASARCYQLARRNTGDRIMTVQVTPDENEFPGEVVLLVSSGDFREYFRTGTAEAGILENLIAGKHNVRVLDLTASGMFARQTAHALRCDENEAAAFDEPYFTMRVNDVLVAAKRLQEAAFSKILIMASGSAVPVALAAAALTGLPVQADLEKVDDSLFDLPENHQPLIGRIGRMAGLLLLNIAPGSVFCNPGETYEALLKKYGAVISHVVDTADF